MATILTAFAAPVERRPRARLARVVGVRIKNRDLAQLYRLASVGTPLLIK
jgi:hypothetical protein